MTVVQCDTICQHPLGEFCEIRCHIRGCRSDHRNKGFVETMAFSARCARRSMAIVMSSHTHRWEANYFPSLAASCSLNESSFLGLAGFLAFLSIAMTASGEPRLLIAFIVWPAALA